MKFKNLVIFILVVLTVFAFFSQVMAAETVVLKLAHVCAANHPYQLGAEKLAELVDQKTNGTLKINTYPAAALGGERDICEGIQMGTIDMIVNSMGVTATFVPEVNVFNLPFIFKDAEHFKKVAYGSVGEKLLKSCEEAGFKGLTFCAPIFRQPMNNVRPIITPDDFKGIKMRLMEVPIHIATYRAMGATPTPIPFAELYSALQLGTVDGNENALGTLYTKKVYEVQKYLSLLPVFSNGAVLLMGLKQWNALSAEHKQAILDSIPEFRKTVDDAYLQMEDESLKKMRDYGVIVDNPPIEPFVKSVKSVYEEYLKKNPEMKAIIDEIKQVD
ncbi:MAG TPA: TRAP transporter substrate-binding protein [Candidatus Atribacteria bacterium]|nr:TRAP transporter substrate-binding protein [Candidatus Atribacteria bacterium]